MTAASTIGAIPECIQLTQDEGTLIVRISRPEKRNSLSDELVLGLSALFAALPASVSAVVLHGEGDHFCAGLDLNEVKEGTLKKGLQTSAIGQRLNDLVQYCAVPVIAVLHGAVIGGGLELACAAHIRVAEPSAFYALPEGVRGIFLGSGGSVRIPRLIGTDRVMDMMLTGRTYGAEDGYRLGFSQYLEPAGEGLAKGLELARKVAQNAPLANYAILQALPHIVEQDPASGLMTERLMTTLAASDEEAKQRLRDFLERKMNKVAHH
ncbi:crotonase/enoyl-CoA hydratase family protein [Herbaspirillum autotrophicum]|uniref:crotonase/enoyl-CoA hydratase family protein n=1 Tax=Herbaspirillum autotrophicum TaxID=180195 RepID=UPI00067CD87B|nr:crotonase/enoyl-CoA hydratase family protein [Herbaspirillum autotrophicum]